MVNDISHHAAPLSTSFIFHPKASGFPDVNVRREVKLWFEEIKNIHERSVDVNADV